MYGIFTYIYHTNQANVRKYAMHGYTAIGMKPPLSWLAGASHAIYSWLGINLDARGLTKMAV